MSDGYAAARRAGRARDEYEQAQRQKVNKSRVEEVCARFGFPIQQASDTAVALGQIAAALESLWSSPRLGCATTRQLLEELAARGRVGSGLGIGGVSLVAAAEDLLRKLPLPALDYRTVDS